MSTIGKMQTEELSVMRQIIGGINHMATVPPSVWNMCKLWTDALQSLPGSQLRLDDDGELFVIKPDGEIVPVGNLPELASAAMGEPESAARN